MNTYPFKIPCKRTHCLKFAACVGKSSVNCDDLQAYFDSVHTNIKNELSGDTGRPVHSMTLEERNNAWERAWSVIRYDLPNVKAIYLNTEGWGHCNDTRRMKKLRGGL